MGLVNILEGVDSWDDLKTKMIATASSSEIGRTLFEEFAKYYFQIQAGEDYKNIYLYKEIPEQLRNDLGLTRNDIGIDLLLENSDGTYHAVQCKFRQDDDATLHWSQDKIGNFFGCTTAVQGYIIFSNATEIDKYIAGRGGQANHFQFINGGNLINMDGGQFESIRQILLGQKPTPPPPKKPRPHQELAIEKSLLHYQQYDRGQLILPCGAGKTLTALWVAERLPEMKNILVLLPSLALLKQCKDEWKKEKAIFFNYLCVCSADDIDRNDDGLEIKDYEIDMKVSLHPPDIKNFLHGKSERKVIFSTYQSSKRIEEAVAGSDIEFDIAICDEAHRTAGVGKKLVRPFTLIHDDANIKVGKRLYMTATPRVAGANLQKKLADAGDDNYAYSMDDEKIFGKEIHRMNFADAIEKEILVDYDIIGMGVRDEDISDYLNERRIEATGFTLDDIANNYALEKIFEKYGLHHAITFHTRVAQAENFQTRHRDFFTKTKKTESFVVSGKDSVSTRSKYLKEFKTATRAVLSNAKCLNEGVDVPTIDSVIFCDPKKSIVDIVQATGRALRTAPNKKKGYVVVPIYHKKETRLDDVAGGKIFAPLIAVVKAMADQDARLQDEINAIASGQKKIIDGGAGDSKIKIEFANDSNITLINFGDELRTKLFAEVIEKTSNPWQIKFQKLCDYRQANPDAWPAQSHEELGSWVSTQRIAYNKGLLPLDRIEKLESIDFIWDVIEAQWQDTFQKLCEYRHANPDDWPAPTYEKLGLWVRRQREAYNKGILSAERKKKLESINFIWDMVEAQWQDVFQKLCEYRHANPDDWPATNHEELGLWIAEQRTVYKKKKLSPKRERKLESIDFLWDPLDAKWQDSFQKLLAYRKINPDDWPVQSHEELGSWVSTQRIAYNKGLLPLDRIEKLEAISFIWEAREAEWQDKFKKLTAYRQANSNDLPIKSHEEFGGWIGRQRQAYKKGTLSEERIEKLESIGFLWDAIESQWQDKFRKLIAYRKINPNDWPAQSHEEFGSWLNTQRQFYKKGKLPADKIKKLESIGFLWDMQMPLQYEMQWQDGYKKLLAYRQTNPDDWPLFSHEELGKWVDKQRTAYKKGKLSADRIKKLQAIDFIWDAIEAQWQDKFEKLIAYRKVNPDGRPTRTHKELGLWIRTQRQFYKKGKLSPDKIKKLESIGFIWDPFEAQWQNGFQKLLAYRKINTNAWPVYSHKELGKWVNKQRASYKKGTLSHERKKKLESIDFIWDVIEAQWQDGFQKLCAYRKIHPNDWPRQTHKELSTWIDTKRQAYKNGTLSRDKIEKLESIGFIWDMQMSLQYESQWQDRFQKLLAYRKINPNDWPARSHEELGLWVSNQRVAYKKRKLPPDKIKKLESIGFPWVLRQTKK